MLSFRLTEDILEIIETTHSFIKTDRQYWYYNIKSWKQSSTGKENSKIDRDVCSAQIEWVKQYYLPKVIVNYQG